MAAPDRGEPPDGLPPPHDARLSALGEMAVGVAHGLNNLLAAIASQATELLERATDRDQEQGLRLIQQAALDGSLTTRRLLRFNRGQDLTDPTDVELVDLNAVVEDAVRLTRSRWEQASTISVAVELGSPPTVRGVAADLREVTVNLIVNAVEAMPDGGRVLLRTEGADGRAVLICADTGVGMPDDVRQRIFEPFFTTKGEAGTGVGLALLRRVVAGHGGDVRVDSRPGRGTTFAITLPEAEPHGPTPPAPLPEGTGEPSPRPFREGVGLSVLIVDDDERFRASFARLLAADGHAVTAVGDGQTALAKLGEAAWDLICVDEGLPDTVGTVLARQVRERLPATFIALVSGFATARDDAAMRMPWIDAVLPKPYKAAELDEILASARTRRATR